MRIFVAGASGVIGVRLTPLLVEAGHDVAGLTRSPAKTDLLAGLGAEPCVADVFDVEALTTAVVGFGPDVVIHELTDLPDDANRIAEHATANARIRREGTDNLLQAAAKAGADRFLAQSVAWELPGDAGEAVRYLEERVLAAGGVVLRYGQFYGPGTFHTDEIPAHPRIQIDRAASMTLESLSAASGVITIAEEPAAS